MRECIMCVCSSSVCRGAAVVLFISYSNGQSKMT